MDVKTGHCWRCEKTLPLHLVRCDRCTKAVYCRDLCRQQDQVRHGAVECQIFGPKCCNYCKKTGDHKQCARCSNAWYCNVSCQRKDRMAHKELCEDMQCFIEYLALKLTPMYTALAEVDPSNPKGAFADPPYYFGSTMAYDFLQLEENEWARGDTGEEDLARDYHVLSAGCGDLRNTLLTAASLPVRYKGKLHVTLNDFDPCVMARNVLFLFMMTQDADSTSVTSSLATIWYSLHISEKDYKLIKTSLQQLMETNAESLRDLTGGLVIINDEDLAKLREVWKSWCSLPCQCIQSSSINLSEQRRASFDRYPTFTHELQLYQERLSSTESKFIGQWFKHGLFLPDDTKQSDLPYNNPTLMGRVPETSTVPQGFGKKGKIKSEYVFGYCIHPILTPFKAWDCLRVREHAQNPSSSVIMMYHAYVVHLLQKMKTLLDQGRLHIHLLVCSCLDIPSHHKTLKMVDYDRIFSSNLSDYIGFRKLLQTFRRLLNFGNKNATIVTETMNWIVMHTPEANVYDLTDIQGTTKKTMVTMHLCEKDTGKALSSPLAVSNQLEYLNNSSWFMAYLRANMMAGCLGIPTLDDVPSLKQAMQCEGMCMRDFRKELNKLVPFQYRVNARILSQVTGAERAVEWYVQPAED